MLGGREFESRHRILDRSIFTFICCEIVLMLEKKINKKRPVMAHFMHFLFNKLSRYNRSVINLYIGKRLCSSNPRLYYLK